MTTSCAGGRHNMPPLPCDLMTLKVVSESRVTWATSVPILVFLASLFSTWARCTRQTDRQTDRCQTDVRQHHRLMPPPRRRGIIIFVVTIKSCSNQLIIEQSQSQSEMLTKLFPTIYKHQFQISIVDKNLSSSNTSITSCARGDTICPRRSPPHGRPIKRLAPPNRRNLSLLSHAEYVPTLTAAAALCVKAVLSKAAWLSWPLTFLSWKWCPSHVWYGLPLCQF